MAGILTAATAAPAFAIRGGEPVAAGEYPYIVEIQVKTDEIGPDWVPLCTASLIDPRVVLTAGHCMWEHSADPENVEMRLVFGRSKVSDPIEHVVDMDGVQDIFTTYIPGSPLNEDIATIILEEDVPGIDPVPLIGLGDAPQPSDIITAAGWGKTESGRTDALRDVDIPVGVCPDFARTMVCAGDMNAGASSGDSGGPGFVRNPDGTMRQIGISSGLNLNGQSMYTNLAVPEPWDTIRDDLTAAGFEALIPR